VTHGKPPQVHGNHRREFLRIYVSPKTMWKLFGAALALATGKQPQKKAFYALFEPMLRNAIEWPAAYAGFQDGIMILDPFNVSTLTVTKVKRDLGNATVLMYFDTNDILMKFNGGECMSHSTGQCGKDNTSGMWHGQRLHCHAPCPQYRDIDPTNVVAEVMSVLVAVEVAVALGFVVGVVDGIDVAVLGLPHRADVPHLVMNL
jgi:hypothetical protein